MQEKELILIFGPTAVGKTDYSIEMAKEYGSPVISCDSRQIFKEMKIGTAPPSEEQLRQVKHYFIFSHSVTDYYTAGKYELEALALLEELFKTHDHLVMCGGSGLYIDALCNGLDDFPEADQTLRAELMRRLQEEGIESLRMELKMLDPESYESIDLANHQRIVRALEVTLMTGRKFSSFKTQVRKQRPFRIRKIYLDREREELYDRINRRVDIMMADGLLAEAESLLCYRHMPALNTVGYKELFAYFDGNVSLEEAVELIKRNSRRYAKRQQTWWRKEEENRVLLVP
ncbi:MAG: tRNA (adenosine(37)-N6)-dimethylallyltransferase MiaA [Bacteroidales bacterium]|nr:tRNA (adenosine(37)-N6)-dimethylallyltransferase MiaA [Bacteroidales bacterium]